MPCGHYILADIRLLLFASKRLAETYNILKIMYHYIIRRAVQLKSKSNPLIYRNRLHERDMWILLICIFIRNQQPMRICKFSDYEF